MKSAACLLAATVLLATALLVSGCMSYPSDRAGSNVDRRATLNGAHEVPANASTAGASLQAQYSKETQILKYRLVVNGLSSPITRASFHGPDTLDADAALAPINTPFNGTYQEGGTTLTPAQAADVLAGRWYVEIQTEQFPAGEIRGQILKTR